MKLSPEEKERRKQERLMKKWNSCHKIIDGVTYKLCTICDDFYPMNEENFYKKKSYDGYDTYCKKCCIIRQQQRYWNDEEAGREYSRKWARENKERHKIMKQNWDANNKEYAKELRSNWRRDNPNKVSEYNKDRKMNKYHDITDEEWYECLDYFNNSCAYCGLSEKEQYHLYNEQFHKEHVFHDGSNYIDNCVPSCTSCNTSKHTSELKDWYCESNQNFSKDRWDKIVKWMTEECFNVLNLI